MLPAMTDSTIQEMKDRIGDDFPNRPTILGSQLGEILTPFISPYRKFSEIGGLKDFVSKYLADTLEWTGRTDETAGDDNYRILAGQEVEWKDVELLPPTLFWVAFSNPRSGSRFSVPPSKTALYYCPSVACNLPGGWDEIPKILEDDYRSMAVAFSKSLPLENRDRALEILRQPGFNPSWVSFLKNAVGHDFLKTWEETRINGVSRHLRSSLTEIGCPTESISRLNDVLLNSRVAARSLSKKTLPGAFPKASSFRPPQYGNRRSADKLNGATDPLVPQDLSLRELVHKAVDRMTLDDLRALSVPIGVLLDAMKSS